MGKSSQAYLDDIERRIASGELDRMVDPYIHDIALIALRKIAAGHANAVAVARVALDRINDRKGAQ